MESLKKPGLSRYHAVKILVGFKALIILLASFSPFVHPHIIRQVDTMGVAIRYWLRWSVEPTLAHPLLPAVLNAGDNYGISPMEFPLLNLITAPFFAAGVYSGRITASLFVVGLYLFLCFIHYRAWKDIVILGIKVEKTSYLFLIYGVSQMYIGRFMPDFLAFILISIAIGLSWNRTRPFSFILLSALAMLIKPPVIIAYGVLLLKPFKQVLKNFIIYIIPALAIVLSYYTIGMDNLRELSDMPKYFAVHFRDPLSSLISFFQHPKEILEAIFKSIFPAFTLALMLGVFLRASHRKTLLPLFGILGLQFLAGASLDGDHIFIHDYYYIGTSFISCLLFLYFLKHAGKYLCMAVLIILGAYQIERGVYETRQVFGHHIWKQCQDILETKFIGDSYKINSPIRRYSMEGVCMGKIQNAPEEKNYIEVRKDRVIYSD